MGSFEKGDRGARILKIQTILQGNPRGLTTGEIARRTGVNPRTTYRDVKALEAMNVPVYEEAGRIAIDPNYFIAPVKFTLREAMALLMGVRLMSRHSDEADPDVGDAFTKLAAVLPAPVAEYVHATVRQMAARPPNPVYSRVLQTVALGWAGRKVVRIWYPRADHAVKRRRVCDWLAPSQQSAQATRELLAGDPQRRRVRRDDQLADSGAVLSEASGIGNEGIPQP